MYYKYYYTTRISKLQEEFKNFCKGGIQYMWIYTAYITLKNGRRLYASECGKKAFRFWADDEKSKTKPPKRENDKFESDK